VSVLNMLYKVLIKILKVIAITTIAAMVIVVFYSVISRFILNTSIAWAEEISRFLMAWMTLTGSIVAYEENKHMSFDSLVKSMPPVFYYAITLFGYALVFCLLINMTKGGYIYARNQWNWTSPATHAPYGLVYSIAPISMSIMALQSAIKFISTSVESVKHFRKAR